MSVIDKLVRLLQDDYKVGVEMRSGKPLVYIDPDKIDTWRLERDVSKGDKEAISEQLATQLDEQYPGLSKRFTQDELVQLTKDSLSSGPFSHKLQGGSPLCLINEPKGDQIDPDKIYDTLGLSKKFNPAHLKPLPGSSDEWEQLVGEHEGEHCNQAPIYNIDPDADVKTLDGETRSDKAALATLEKEGKHEIAQAWKDIRVLAAANGDDKHATSIFLDDPNFEGAKPEHLEAARRFREEMCLGVAQNMGITAEEAEKLRLSDPQKFANSVEEAYINGDIPALRDMDEDGIQKRIAAEMGMTDEEFDTLKVDQVGAIAETYKKLKAEGELKDYGPDNPHIDTYIFQYVDATRRMFIEDTTPAADAVPAAPAAEATPAPTTAPEPTPEERAAKSDQRLKRYAEDEAELVMDELAKKSLGLSDDEVAELKEKDPDRYIDGVEKELKKGDMPLQTERMIDKEEREALIAKKLGVAPEDLKNQPEFLKQLATNNIVSNGEHWVKEDNPYLKDEMEKKIKDYREEKARTAEETAEMEQPEASESASPATETAPSSSTPLPAPAASAQLSASASASAATTPAARGSYDYLSETRPDTGNGVPQIDLRSGERGQMRIGSLSTREYFALQADPVLAQQQLDQQATMPAPEIDQKFAMQQPKAQTTQSYAPA